MRRIIYGLAFIMMLQAAFLNTFASGEENARIICSYDFENGTLGQTPVGFEASNDPVNGKYATVENSSGIKAVRVRAVKANGKPATSDPLFGLLRSYAGNIVINFKFKYESTKATTPIVFYEGSTGKTINFIQINPNNTINVAGQQNLPYTINIGTWYSGAIFLNSYTNMVSLKINGQAVGNPGSLLTVGNVTKINYSSLSMRFLMWNWTDNTTADLYIDDFGIITYETPQITLKGTERHVLETGSSYQEPGYQASDLIDGDVTGKVIVGGDRVIADKVGSYVVSYDVTTADGTKAQTKYRTVIVKDVNLLAGCGVTAGDSAEAYPIANINDKNESTIWRPGVNKVQAAFTVDLKKEGILDRLILVEEFPHIQAYTLEHSVDGSTWAFADHRTEAGDYGTTIVFSPVAARYIRMNITSASISNDVGISICELEGYVKPENVLAADYTLTKFTAKEDRISEDIVLDRNGKYGSKITWKSSDPSVILDNGTVIRPETDTQVTLTAVLSYKNSSVEKAFPPVTVAAKVKKKQSGGGGGGGSRSSGKSAKVITETIVPASQAEVTAPVVQSVPGKVFKDIEEGYWAKEYIDKMVKKGIVSGTSDDSFEPERKITREEFLKLLINALDIEKADNRVHFQDVAENAWYYAYVATAEKKGITKGINESEFGIGNSIKREEMAVMVCRTLDLAGVSTEAKDTVKGFTDEALIEDYAKDSVRRLQGMGVIEGDKNGEFEPEGILTRAQAVKILSIISEKRSK